jgi:hypothetical protein
MAENKKSFLLYCDIIHTVEKLTDEQAGKLLKHTLKYVNDLNPTPEDILTEIAFEPIKQSLKRDLLKYEGIRVKNKENANKRWADKNNATASERIPSDTKNADSDSDSDSVIDKSILGSIEPLLPSPTEVPKNLKKEKKKDGGAKIKFQDSDIFDPTKFKEAFPNWTKEKLRYYYDSALNYSEQGNKYLNWTSAIRTWESREEFKNIGSTQQTINTQTLPKNRYKVHG